MARPVQRPSGTKEKFARKIRSNLESKTCFPSQIAPNSFATLGISMSYYCCCYDALFLTPLATGSVFIKTHQSMHDGVGRQAAIEISLIFLHIIVQWDCR